MKSPQNSRLHESLFQSEMKEQPVRLIKAAQAGKLLHSSSANGHGSTASSNESENRKKPEVRLIHSGADYCDIEIICGCGESTQVRCWNTASTAESKSA